MSVYTCEVCGSLASTLARCPECGTVVRNSDQSGNPPGALRRIAPLLLGLVGLGLAAPAATKAADAYSVRIAQNQAAKDSLLKVESDRQQLEERQVMIARADSVLKAIPRSRIPKLTTDQIKADITIVGSRSDSLAQRWLKGAATELKRRSSRKGRLGTNAVGR
jgi:hypothetical protein